MIPRDYQAQDIDELRAAFAAGNQRVLHVLPTGTGKTVEFSVICRLAAERGRRVAILVHRDNLLRQASAKLRQAGVKHGIIAPGNRDYGDSVNVASVMTLVRRLDRYEFDLIIIDEAHHALAMSWQKIVNRWPRARVLGVTATPLGPGGKGLGSVFGALHVGKPISWHIRQGYLAAPDTYGPQRSLDLTGIRVSAGDYAKDQLAEHMDTPSITGDAVSHYASICPKSPAIAFCVNIRHAQDTATAFRAAGFSASAVHGKMPLKEISRHIEDLRCGRTRILTSCDLVSEGTDIPAVVCAINLRPTRSLALHIQQAGRALRPIYAPGYDPSTAEGRLAAIAAGPKPKAIILDHAANCFRHLTVDEDREWSLEGVSKRKKKAKADEILLTQCAKCLRPYRSTLRVCPYCGDSRQVLDRRPQVKIGVLEKVDKVALRRSRFAEEHACGSLDALIALGRKRGYNYPERWAHIRWGFMRGKK